MTRRRRRKKERKRKKKDERETYMRSGSEPGNCVRGQRLGSAPAPSGQLWSSGTCTAN
jgi:hypothetical protein